MAEKPLNPPINVALIDPKTGKLTLPWQEYLSQDARKSNDHEDRIAALETP